MEEAPTPIEKGFEKVLSPFQDFIHNQTTSSVLLIICTMAALIIANSPLAHDYDAILETAYGVVMGERALTMDLKHWINEGLMAFFFFLLGMEIKREILVGEMRDLSRIIPVMFAAIGGMLFPAAIFYALNAGTEFAKGWGIPMATDTAFAVGILALLGSRIPQSAFAFLTALAIIDDLGAILIIAIFYSDSISIWHLGVSVLLLIFLITCNLVGVRRPGIYLTLGVILWIAMLGSGIHATIAGILVAATIPARPKREPVWFIKRANLLLRKFERIEKEKDDGSPILGHDEQHKVAERVQDAAEKVVTPLRRWERLLEYPVALFIMPIFALANAGIPLDLRLMPQLSGDTLVVGIILGLVIGKGVGIPLFALLAIRLNLGQLPAQVNIRHVIGLGLLGGIGFTMSMFISGLGFEGTPDALLAAKTGILMASLLAGICGYLWLRFHT